MKSQRYIVSLYIRSERRPCDCLPEFYSTRSDAIAAGQEEVARVAAIPEDKRIHGIDWATRYTVKRVR